MSVECTVAEAEEMGEGERGEREWEGEGERERERERGRGRERRKRESTIATAQVQCVHNNTNNHLILHVCKLTSVTPISNYKVRWPASYKPQRYETWYTLASPTT